MNIMRHALIAVLLTAAIAQAEAPRTNKFKVHLTGNCTPQRVWLVVNGDENTMFELKWDTGAWRGDWHSKTDKTELLPPEPNASLHLGDGARTWSRKSQVADDDVAKRGKVNELTFECDSNPTKTVWIDTESSVGYTYVRRMNRKPYGDSRDFPLLETSGPDYGCHGIANLRYRQERVRLQLFSIKPDSDAPGLLLNELPAVRDKTKEPVPLTARDISAALCRQHAIDVSSEYSFSPNACEPIDDRLKTLKVTVSVKSCSTAD
jgi:hypothetical protein